MKVESHIVSLSWIPSDSTVDWMRRGFDVGLAHYDEPPVEALPGLDRIQQLRADDRFRFANVLSAWAEFDGDVATSWGYGEDSGVVVGSTTVRLGAVGATFGGYPLPVLRQEPAVEPGSVHVTQTAGGRTGVPLPQRVRNTSAVLWEAPIVWTTLALTLHADGSTDVAMPGASAFPRHWVYGPDGVVAMKTGLTDQEAWMTHSFAARTPWGERDSEAVVAEAERAVERQLSEGVMRAGHRPEIRRLPVGAVLAREGEPCSEICLVLDGVLTVSVDGSEIAEVGPGAVLGEREVLDDGSRTSTLVALTPVRLAVAAADAIDVEKLRAMAELFGREERRPATQAAAPE
ncbi:cyclic nucleotide-binding domain-containing protein [Georgenia sp. SYP-B2076]|uniref:cyclic nucleotide-binding domain-containing protein n=1 Tax=Georgenia sp. SYP-B2076 TaxID=2495881 RepID=UPI000F8EE52F|nr:cyclic nucleotide-binding domain-containing protein [Georgenia sp. SYP-B2076]